MKDLLNKVASKAKDKWKIVGIQLEIVQDQLNTIKAFFLLLGLMIFTL